jgi:hypothetical protein
LVWLVFNAFTASVNTPGVGGGFCDCVALARACFHHRRFPELNEEYLDRLNGGKYALPNRVDGV